MKCETCSTTKAVLNCGLCNEEVCKNCATLYGDDAFSFMEKVPDELTKGIYCPTCFATKVSEQAEAYEALVEKAGQIDVYFKDQGKETRLIPRAKKIRYEIATCGDRDELVMRFAFFAARDGYSTIVDVDVRAEKVRNGSYQTTNYSGSATPANARAEHVIRDKSIRHNPN